MRVQPLGQRVVVKRADSDEKTEGGLYMPEGSAKRKHDGVVVEIGDARVARIVIVRVWEIFSILQIVHVSQQQSVAIGHHGARSLLGT